MDRIRDPIADVLLSASHELLWQLRQIPVVRDRALRYLSKRDQERLARRISRSMLRTGLAAISRSFLEERERLQELVCHTPRRSPAPPEEDRRGWWRRRDQALNPAESHYRMRRLEQAMYRLEDAAPRRVRKPKDGPHSDSRELSESTREPDTSGSRSGKTAHG